MDEVCFPPMRGTGRQHTFTPYEMQILLDVYAGASIKVNRFLPLFVETMQRFIDSGLVIQEGISAYARTEKLAMLAHYVLSAPMPVLNTRPKLSSRQSAVLVFIQESLATYGRPPTLHEIADHFGFKSPNAAHDLLKVLKEKGYIEIHKGISRGIKLIP